MQIPDTPLKFIAGLLARPPVSSGRQIDPALHSKVIAHRTPAGARPAVDLAARLSRLGAAGTLDEAVQSLRAEGRLPRRGSLLDIRA